MRRRLAILGVSLLLLASMVVPSVVYAVNPIVTIHVTAQVVAITNDKDAWEIGTIDVNSIKYFSVDNAQNNTYSTIENTGNVAVDIEIQGTTITDGVYPW